MIIKEAIMLIRDLIALKKAILYRRIRDYKNQIVSRNL